MSNWVGYAVSVNCGEPLGCYQGTIIEADGSTISLTKPFRNGFPYPKSQVTLNAADIKELKIIESRPEPSEQTHSTVPVSKISRRTPRATVCENLQANQTGTGHNNGQNNNGGGGGGKARNNNGNNSNCGLARSKPIDIQGNNKNNKNNSHNNNHSGSYNGGGGGCGGGSGSTPRGRGGGSQGGGGGTRGEHARRRNEACFGAPLATEPDFDFEKNLALFDKQALWEQMRTSGRPDVVPPQHNYAPNENVLSGGGVGGGGSGGGGGGGGGTGTGRAGVLRLPASWLAPSRYVTDEGRRVPAATSAARRVLWAALERGGGLAGALVLLGRAAADVALRLVGGERRLDPRNTHQQPALTVRLPSSSSSSSSSTSRDPRAGASLVAARLLASHGARVSLVLPSHSHTLSDPLAPSLPVERALREAGVALYEEGDSVPKGDLALIFGDASSVGSEKATLLVEPECAQCVEVEVEGVCSARATMWALVPGASSPAHGHVYLANVAPPPSLYSQFGAHYCSPFGATHLLTLHPDHD